MKALFLKVSWVQQQVARRRIKRQLNFNDHKWPRMWYLVSGVITRIIRIVENIILIYVVLSNNILMLEWWFQCRSYNCLVFIVVVSQHIHLFFQKYKRGCVAFYPQFSPLFPQKAFTKFQHPSVQCPSVYLYKWEHFGPSPLPLTNHLQPIRICSIIFTSSSFVNCGNCGVKSMFWKHISWKVTETNAHQRRRLWKHLKMFISGFMRFPCLLSFLGGIKNYIMKKLLQSWDTHVWPWIFVFWHLLFILNYVTIVWCSVQSGVSLVIV